VAAVPSAGKVGADLGGVAETVLWTTYQRSVEARRQDAVLDDPEVIALVDRIDYPFEQRFGGRGFSQWQALRARCFDREVRRFLGRHPDGTVAALGEGFETQFWRVDNGRVQWLSVDVPETIRLREILLPQSPRLRTLACSAFEERWIDEVAVSRGALVTAQGLLMYFERSAVHGLIATCARRLPRGELVFDAVPEWLSKRSQRGDLKTAGGYQAPPWLWSVNADKERRLASLHPNITELRALRLPRGRSALHGFAMPILSRVPPCVAGFFPSSVPNSGLCRHESDDGVGHRDRIVDRDPRLGSGNGDQRCPGELG
jgi:O-methyltransferase involved in polyketide biosynthesis